jgi:hypothetical protein
MPWAAIRGGTVAARVGRYNKIDLAEQLGVIRIPPTHC